MSCVYRAPSRLQQLWMAALVLGLSGTIVRAADLPVEPAVSKPFQKIELRFFGQGIIKTVEVKDGDVVKAQQVLATQDDAIEQQELKILQLDANDIAVQAAKANHEAKKAEFDRVKKIHANQGGNDEEYDRLKAEAEVARLNILKEEQDMRKAQAKVEKQRELLKKMQLLSPAEGVVQSVDVHVGETVDPGKPPLVVIVQNNPLKVELYLPSKMGDAVKIGQTFRVSYDMRNWAEAKASYKAPMADAGSGLQTIHLELPNPDGRPSGLQMWVQLPAEVAAQKQSAATALK